MALNNSFQNYEGQGTPLKATLQPIFAEGGQLSICAGPNTNFNHVNQQRHARGGHSDCKFEIWPSNTHNLRLIAVKIEFADKK